MKDISGLAAMVMLATANTVLAGPRLDGQEMVTVPAACFLMGAEGGYCAERPTHEVCLNSYEIDRVEVTNAAYGACVKKGVCRPAGWPDDGVVAAPGEPVTKISHSDAERYCRSVGKRLPTEAEWEYAGRGQDGRLYPWGDEAPACEDANFGAWPARYFRCGAEYWCAHAKVCLRENPGRVEAVGSRPRDASPFGVLDLSGNVFEWVADRFDPGYYLVSDVKNPRGPEHGDLRTVRGGAFSGTEWSVRLTSRQPMPEGTRHGSLGFRCARTLAEDAPAPRLRQRPHGTGCPAVRPTSPVSRAALARR